MVESRRIWDRDCMRFLKPEIFTIWAFTENIYQFLSYIEENGSWRNENDTEKRESGSALENCLENGKQFNNCRRNKWGINKRGCCCTSREGVGCRLKSQYSGLWISWREILTLFHSLSVFGEEVMSSILVFIPAMNSD